MNNSAHIMLYKMFMIYCKMMKKKDGHNNYHCEFQAQCMTTMKMGFM